MKTAVSIPTPLFQQAERRARKLGVSRSELYARALERLLRQEPDLDVTKALEAVYSADDSSIDRPLAVAQQRATAEKWYVYGVPLASPPTMAVSGTGDPMTVTTICPR